MVSFVANANKTKSDQSWPWWMWRPWVVPSLCLQPPGRSRYDDIKTEQTDSNTFNIYFLRGCLSRNKIKTFLLVPACTDQKGNSLATGSVGWEKSSGQPANQTSKRPASNICILQTSKSMHDHCTGRQTQKQQEKYATDSTHRQGDQHT